MRVLPALLRRGHRRARGGRTLRRAPLPLWAAAPSADFAAATIALAAGFALAGGGLLLAPVFGAVFVVLAWCSRIYAARAPQPTLRTAWLVMLVAAADVLLLDGLRGPEAGPPPVALWVAAVTLVLAVRVVVSAADPRLRMGERWLVVGSTAWAASVDAIATQAGAAKARVVATADPVEARLEGRRLELLDELERLRIDRVILSPGAILEPGIFAAASPFKALGVPVSLLPGPAAVLGDPAISPVLRGGLAAIDIGEISADLNPPTEEVRNALSPAPPPLSGPRVSVVIPTRNEAENLPHVLRRLPGGLHEVILVDGNSSDRTVEVARRFLPGIRILHQKGSGKGDALRLGFAAVTGDIVVTLDADGSADPAEIPRFVEALGDADLAKGSRFLPGGGSTDITATRRLGNRALSGMTNRLHGTDYTDLCYGYNAFWTHCLPFIAGDCSGFEIEALVNTRIARAGLRIVEVPSFETERLHGETNLRTYRDGARVLATIVREWRPSRRRRLPQPPQRSPHRTQQRVPRGNRFNRERYFAESGSRELRHGGRVAEQRVG